MKINKSLNFKKTFSDFAYSIGASLLSTGILQLVVYPLLAKQFDPSFYGQLLTIMGIINIVSVTLGNTLNNTRLIQNSKYVSEDKFGDFQIILLIANIIGMIIVSIVGIVLFTFSLITIVLLLIMVVLAIVRSYYLVSYRIVLNFKLNLICSMFISVGYIIGVIIANYNSVWPIIFIIPDILAIIFIILTTQIHKEPFVKTNLIGNTTSKYLLLVVTGLIGNMLMYLDRLIIYPIMGGEYVAIYSAASFMGKSISLVLLPISGVMLSYFSQNDYKMTIKKFWKINAIVISFSVLFIVFSIFVSPLFTGFIYPTLISAALPYLFLANTAAIIGSSAALSSPILLKYAPTYWQVIIQVSYCIVYLLASILMIIKSGLIGLCIAAIISNLFRLGLTYLIGSIYIGKDIKV